ncbi:hypothetical protein BTJ68_05674 [Hortaea werneckii EXF-2000]|uniref:Uncharacterized protein n=1 Tax=Hortaea werneckii EXF-2000 TaxID=1157616 RepID=A0A1Z5TA88_HORWE|nr:hypothetical protein BTJ68_05674 [Hortaea werneckii EXF-2000]
MVSVVCIAAVLIPVGEIWFAWSGTPDVPWIVPILAGIPFGMGNCAVFIYAPTTSSTPTTSTPHQRSRGTRSCAPSWAPPCP